MADFNEDTTIALAGGGVEYDVKEAAVEIEALIQSLEEAKEDGATHVVMLSGNYRGAQWASVQSEWDWINER